MQQGEPQLKVSLGSENSKIAENSKICIKNERLLSPEKKNP